MKYIYLFLISMLVSVNSLSDTALQYQNAGMFGQHSLSYVTINENHSWGVGFGFVEESSHADDITLYNVFYSYNCFSPISFELDSHLFKLNPCGIGFSLIYGNSDELFGSLPDQYPDGYYYPTAIRTMLNYKISLDINQKINVYIDFNMIDIAFVSYLRNNEFFRDHYDYLGLEGVINYGLGVRWNF